MRRTTWPRNPGYRVKEMSGTKTLIERIITGHAFGVRFERWDEAGVLERAKIAATGIGRETETLLLEHPTLDEYRLRISTNGQPQLLRKEGERVIADILAADAVLHEK